MDVLDSIGLSIFWDEIRSKLKAKQDMGVCLPLDGSGTMKGNLRMGPLGGIFFGNDADVYFGDGHIHLVVDPGIEEISPDEPVADEIFEEFLDETAREPLSAESGEEETEDVEVSAAIEFMQLYSASLGAYIPLSVGAPVRPSDAATKAYVDGLMGNIASLLDQINGEVA